ncbi:DNA cytosine methyltransferase [Halocatena halophila]|uniref:DNA cytosine methyltransferase n=1 Tax=Halocatena halophila TaxID=2814576 RepID=UPI002ED22203
MTLTAIDLFCGGGGTSTGLALAAEELDREIELIPVNHWSVAIETHQQNHPWADHYNASVEELHPPALFDGDPDVDLLVASPECTHFSRARGGKPIKEQQRASPWHVVDWLEKLNVDAVLVENVPDMKSWGPVRDGEPSRNGEIFEAWIDSLHALGYSVDWKILNSANYGDATSRKRLFVVGRKEKRAQFPEPTHSPDGHNGTEPYRSAAEIIDWDDCGESIWSRSRPLVQNTMQRIAEGLRRYTHDALEPFADAVEELGKPEVSKLQENIVEAEHVPRVAAEVDEPFLACAPTVGLAADGGEIEDVCGSFVLGQHGGAVARDLGCPLPTIATKGAIGLYHPEAFILPRNGYHGGLHSNPAYRPEERPLHTVTASNHDGHFVVPYLVEYYGNGSAQSIDDPLPTVTTKDRFALVVPECYPWGLDIRFRMLQPRELAAAMGFPDDYQFSGNKTETTKQIGNAVPVNLAKALCKTLLTGEQPSLQTFADQEVPCDD